MDFSFFSNTGFMPHGHCFLWRPEILWLHVISDGVIFLSYMIIPMTLILSFRKAKWSAYKWVLVMFSLFILFCGITHGFSIWTMWRPNYFTEGFLKAITAAISFTTALLFIPLAPKVFRIFYYEDGETKSQSTEK